MADKKNTSHNHNDSKDQLLDRSDVFCMAAFVHQNLAIHGEIWPCCTSATMNSELAFGNLKKGDTLQSAWNSEPSRALRRDMLSEQKNPLCNLCYKGEVLGKESARQWMNKEFEHYFEKVEQTRVDGTLDEHELAYLDIRLSNLCNLKCRICHPYASSNWYSDGLALKLIDENFVRNVKPFEDDDGLWAQLEPLLKKMERIHFAGGEPVIMEAHYHIIQYLVDNDLTHVQLSYNTNFSKSAYKNVDFFDLWKKFEHVILNVSLDGNGQRGEYMRKGLDWEQTVALRKRMLKEIPHVKFTINAVSSILNVLHLPDFYRAGVTDGFIEPGEFAIQYLHEPSFYDARRLPPLLKKSVEQKYNDLIGDIETWDIPFRHRILDQFKGAINFIQEEDLPMLQSFYTFSDKLDELREECTEDTFPELKELFSSEMRRKALPDVIKTYRLSGN